MELLNVYLNFFHYHLLCDIKKYKSYDVGIRWKGKKEKKKGLQ